MARRRNDAAYEQARTNLLEVGLALIRTRGFESTGLNDILKSAGLPKGSFYHYFANKEAFGIAVAEAYHQQQLAFASQTLRDNTQPPGTRLHRFFSTALQDFEQRQFKEGCLMCNLSTELGDTADVFRAALARHWDELAQELATCLLPEVRQALHLAHLTDKEAADTSWQGSVATQFV